MTSFDDRIDRTQYPTTKWNHAMLNEHFGSADVTPFWVADMDFRAPPAVVKSIRERAEHGIYGYEYKSDSYFDALMGWYSRRHGWNIDRNHIEDCPTILNAVAVLINQHSDEGDGVIIQSPVFFEFGSVIKSNHRQRVKNALKLVNGRYEIDFGNLEEKAANPRNRILILCNPHNPVGRVWTREELTRVGDICARHGVLIIADEIHGDITYTPHHYTPLASISDDIAQHSVTCLSPAKTFNIAGMVDALVVIPNDAHREQFHDFAHRYQTNKVHVFATAATEAAYQHGDEWLEQLLNYLERNIEFLLRFLEANIPRVKLIEPEGTYLVWLDFRELGLGVKELQKFLSQDAQLALNAGHWFGREGAGFARMNIACPRDTLEKALSNLAQGVERLKSPD
jgi:cysteine-S-conjugate beta-lyase